MKVIHNTNKNNELDDFWSKLETLVENDKNALGNFSKLI